jgi:hypothetical protein
MSEEVVNDEGSSGAIGTGNDARVALLNQIGDGVDVDREDQLANVNNDDTTEPFQAHKQPDDTPPPQPEEVDPPAPVDGEPGAGPTTVKLKVNGKEMELPLEEVIARAQKVESADQYLADAAAQRRALEEQNRAPAPPAPKQEEVDYSAMARALQVGSEEEAVASLKKLVQQATVRPSPQDDVSRMIEERLMFRDAYNGFRSEFKDVVDDPRLFAMALQMDREQTEKGDSRPYAERYTEIGTELRGWVSGFKGSSAPAPAPAGQTRQERKETAPQTPTAAAGKAAPQPQEQEEDDSPAAVVARMAAARGGPQWMRDLPKSA